MAEILGGLSMWLRGRDGDEQIADETIAALAAKYPGVDVGAELAKAHLWLLRNPKGRPKLVMRFVETWMKRSRPARPVNVVALARRDNLNQLCGRQDGQQHGWGSARSVDAADVRAVPRDLWLENVRNVG